MLLKASVVFSLLLTFIWGCNRGPIHTLWSQIDALEKAASKSGTVAAGAPRITDFDNTVLETSRESLRQEIARIKKELQSAIKPEIASAKWSERARYLKLGVDLGSILQLPKSESSKQEGTDKNKGEDKGKEEKPLQSLDNLKEILKELGTVEPNRIDAIIYRLSALRYLESELETLNLAESYPLDGAHYRRVQVSLGLTAWTHDPAVSALVYLDLYPYDADRWCNETLEKVARSISSLNPRQVAQVMTPQPTVQKPPQSIVLEHQDIRANPMDFSRVVDLDKKLLDEIITEARQNLGRSFNSPSFEEKHLKDWLRDRSDPYTGCHNWLQTSLLLPKLVHVDPLGESRFTEKTRGSQTSYDVGLDVSAGSYGKLAGGQKGSEGSAAKQAEISITTLSFAAGERRAGWFFMREGEGEGERNRMRPIERRVKMVVDIPRDLKRLEVHVHKTFFENGNEHPAPFSQQAEQLHQARWLLNDIEEDVVGRVGATDCPKPIREDCYPSYTYWQLMKSRVRNLLSLGWSERLIVYVPQMERPAAMYALKARLVLPEEKQGYSEKLIAVSRGTIEGIYDDRLSLPEGVSVFDDDYQGDFLYPGFIDTHNHPHYNFIPKWTSSKMAAPNDKCKPYCSRYEWQRDPEFESHVKNVYEELKSFGYGIDGLRYGHLRALIGGVTTLQGAEDPGEPPTPIRTLWKSSAASTEKVATLNEEKKLEEYKGALATGKIRRLFGFKVLVQHRYPGQSRDQGVAHGAVPTIDAHGTRRIESHVGRGLQSSRDGSGDAASPEHRGA